MTVAEIRKIQSSVMLSTSEIILAEIAYQLAVQNERIAAADKKSAQIDTVEWKNGGAI